MPHRAFLISPGFLSACPVPFEYYLRLYPLRPELIVVCVIVKLSLISAMSSLSFFCVFYLFKFIDAGTYIVARCVLHSLLFGFCDSRIIDNRATISTLLSMVAMAFCMFWARSDFYVVYFYDLVELLFMFCKLQIPITISTTIKAIMTPRPTS